MNFNYSHTFTFYEVIDSKEKIALNSGNTFYYLGFENIFDSLENDEIEFLNTIYEYSKAFNSGYIDNKVWMSYLATSSITTTLTKEEFITNEEYDNLEINIRNNGKNMNLKLYKEDFKNNRFNKFKQRPLFKFDKPDLIRQNLKIKKPFYIVSKKSAYYNNKLELLISFMNCIFSTRRKLYIKQCDLCKKYYVADKSDTHYCRRKSIYSGKSLTCDLKVATMQKTYEYKTKYETLNRQFLNKINDMKNAIDEKDIENYKKNYKTERDIKKLEYFRTNDINILINFINNYEKENPFPTMK